MRGPPSCLFLGQMVHAGCSGAPWEPSSEALRDLILPPGPGQRRTPLIVPAPLLLYERRRWSAGGGAPSLSRETAPGSPTSQLHVLRAATSPVQTSVIAWCQHPHPGQSGKEVKSGPPGRWDTEDQTGEVTCRRISATGCRLQCVCFHELRVQAKSAAAGTVVPCVCVCTCVRPHSEVGLDPLCPPLCDTEVPHSAAATEGPLPDPWESRPASEGHGCTLALWSDSESVRKWEPELLPPVTSVYSSLLRGAVRPEGPASPSSPGGRQAGPGLASALLPPQFLQSPLGAPHVSLDFIRIKEMSHICKQALLSQSSPAAVGRGRRGRKPCVAPCSGLTGSFIIVASISLQGRAIANKWLAGSQKETIRPTWRTYLHL